MLQRFLKCAPGAHEANLDEFEISLSILLEEKTLSQPVDQHNKKLIERKGFEVLLPEV